MTTLLGQNLFQHIKPCVIAKYKHLKRVLFVYYTFRKMMGMRLLTETLYTFTEIYYWIFH